ncbi:MAG: hypothetical protein HQL37_12045 [Alphaproteobacteria bacterium]|nr:hypothetical protein [Alphaproteobacteria bacterium]
MAGVALSALPRIGSRQQNIMPYQDVTLYPPAKFRCPRTMENIDEELLDANIDNQYYSVGSTIMPRRKIDDPVADKTRLFPCIACQPGARERPADVLLDNERP